MTTGEVLRALETEGISISANGLSLAILAGHVSTPRRDGAGNRHYTRHQYAEVAAYFRVPHKRGRKPQHSRNVECHE